MIALTSVRQVAPLAVSVAFILIIAVSIVLRVYARNLKSIPLQLDDYFIFAATIFTYGLIACNVVGVLRGGVGLHKEDLADADGPGPLVTFLKDLLAFQILWALSLMCVKLSTLSFYLRIFGGHQFFARAAQFIIVLILLWCIGIIGCGLFLCQPFAFNWNQTIPGTCGDQIKSYIITGALNIITDILVLTLPLPFIWNLHAPLANRITLTGTFAVGFFVCVISVLRVVALASVSYTDITYTVAEVLVWSMLEPTLGICLACVPIIRPIFKIFREKDNKGTSSRNLPSPCKPKPRNFRRPAEPEWFLQSLEMGLSSEIHSGPLNLNKVMHECVADVESQKSWRTESCLTLAPACARTPERNFQWDWRARTSPRRDLRAEYNMVRGSLNIYYPANEGFLDC